MIKLQPGDYVSTEGMTEEQYHAVCKAFIEAGARDGESKKINYFHDRVCLYLMYHPRVGVYWSSSSRELKRELTIDQILGSDNTEGAKEMNMSVAEAYKVMQANCGIEVGDTVKVLRKAGDYENGWAYSWAFPLDAVVGETAVVTHLDGEFGICLSNSDGCYVPFFILELVKKGKKLPEPIRISSQHKCEFKEDGSIAVGCQSLDFELIEKIYMTAKEVKNNDN